MRRRSRTRHALKWVGTTSCVVIAVLWVVSGWWLIAYFGDGWLCMIVGGEFEFSPANPDDLVGWGYGRPAQGFQLLMPRGGTIGPGSVGGPRSNLYICPLWLPFILIAVPTLILWSIPWWQDHSGSRRVGVAARCRHWAPLVVLIGVAFSTLAAGLSLGFSDRDSLIAWCFVPVGTAAGCLNVRRRRLLTATAWSLVVAAVYFIAADLVYEWEPGRVRQWADWYNREQIRTVRLFAGGVIAASGMVGYGLTLAITNGCTRLLAQAGRCTRCGYDLTGNVSGRCPECGESASMEREHEVDPS